MLTETMRRAGWRECPSSSVRLLWESTGGRWQQCWKTRKHYKTRELLPGQLAHKGNPSGPIWYRPVNPQTWDVDLRGWGDIAGPESEEWAEWWWQGEGLPPQVVRARRCDGDIEILADNRIIVRLSEMGGRFIAPIPVPEVSNG